MNRIIVYGIGNNFTKNYKWISERYNIIALADTLKAGKICNGFTVLAPDDILRLDFDWVLVTPFIYSDIIDTLKSKGISSEKIKLLSEIIGFDYVGNELSICFFNQPKGIGDLFININ